jgi:hypothetical protein
MSINIQMMKEALMAEPKPFSDEEIAKMRKRGLYECESRFLTTIDALEKRAEDEIDELNQMWLDWVKVALEPGELFDDEANNEQRQAVEMISARIDALQKRVGEFERALSDSPDHSDLDAEKFNTNRLAIENGRLQSRIARLEGALEKATNHIERCGGCLSQTETSELRGILDTALAGKGGDDEPENSIDSR